MSCMPMVASAVINIRVFIIGKLGGIFLWNYSTQNIGLEYSATKSCTNYYLAMGVIWGLL
jgi:hypothetical protein